MALLSSLFEAVPCRCSLVFNGFIFTRFFNMVCVPCFIIPVLLYLFHRFVQPLVYKFWGEYLQEPNFTCPLPAKKKKPIGDLKSISEEKTSASEGETSSVVSSDSKAKSD